MRKRILATLLAFVLLFSGGAVTAYAYNVAVSGGLESTPYSLRWHSSMTTAQKNAISSACGAWTSAGYGKLAELSSYSHTNSYPTDNNYNEISFTGSLEDDVLAQCHRVFTSIFRTKIKTADRGISTSHTFSTGTPSSTQYDLQSVITHEVGHALGLGHPDDTEITAVMYKSFAPGETRRTLSSDDIAGIAAIYD